MVFGIENVAKSDSAVQTPGKLKSSLITPSIYLTLFYPHFICTQELTDEVNKASSTFTSSGISLLRAKAHQSWLGEDKNNNNLNHHPRQSDFRVSHFLITSSLVPTVAQGRHSLLIVNTADRVDPSLLLLIRLRG